MRHLNFVEKKRYAARLTNEQLVYALTDCQKCIMLGLDPEYYSDEASVYRDEITHRAAKRGGKYRTE